MASRCKLVVLGACWTGAIWIISHAWATMSQMGLWGKLNHWTGNLKFYLDNPKNKEFGFVMGLGNKILWWIERNWLYNCFIEDQDRSKTFCFCGKLTSNFGCSSFWFFRGKVLARSCWFEQLWLEFPFLLRKSLNLLEFRRKILYLNSHLRIHI